MNSYLLSPIETTPDKFPRTPADGEADPGVSKVTKSRCEFATTLLSKDKRTERRIHILASNFWTVYASVDDGNTLYTVRLHMSA